MRIFSWAMIAALSSTLGQAHAQACRTLQFQASEVHVESLELFDTSGKPVGRIEKKALPPQFEVSDCNDKVYVMLHLQQHDFLVKQADLAIPPMKGGCLNVARKDLLGVPGAADLPSCEKGRR